MRVEGFDEVIREFADLPTPDHPVVAAGGVALFGISDTTDGILWTSDQAREYGARLIAAATDYDVITWAHDEDTREREAGARLRALRAAPVGLRIVD